MCVSVTICGTMFLRRKNELKATAILNSPQHSSISTKVSAHGGTKRIFIFDIVGDCR